MPQCPQFSVAASAEFGGRQLSLVLIRSGTTVCIQ
jgi:hypothetical protein